MKLVFFGTPEFAGQFLSALHADPFFEIAAVITTSDEPVGRKKELTPSPVKTRAMSLGIPVLQPTKLKDPAFHDTLRAFDADAFVVIAYGRILPQAVLDIPPMGCVNVHPSLLPKLRGPSPIISAIANGETETGVSLMLLDAEMDHGPVLAQTTFPVVSDETTSSLTEKVVAHGAPLLLDTLKQLAAGTATPRAQDHTQATFCALLTREDGKIDWAEPAEVIERKIRAYNPWPGTWTTWNRNGQPMTLKIFAASPSHHPTIPPSTVLVENGSLYVGTGSTALRILAIQPAGGTRMPADAFLRGYADIANAELGV
ncbi:methionyl-tRNA formyltransferase [Candidatus Uhrbacteria bacterium]|nr:methionyl-tRNA formyltransferase [Candidatus Uhrbacteria bacterium]